MNDFAADSNESVELFIAFVDTQFQHCISFSDFVSVAVMACALV